MTKWTFAFCYFARALKEKRILNRMVNPICDFNVILNSFERYSDILLGPQFLHNWLLVGFISRFQLSFFFIGPSRCVVVNICILPSKTQYMWRNINYIRATCFGRETAIFRPILFNYFNFYCKRYGTPYSAHLYCALYVFCIGLIMAVSQPKHVVLM